MCREPLDWDVYDDHQLRIDALLEVQESRSEDDFSGSSVGGAGLDLSHLYDRRYHSTNKQKAHRGKDLSKEDAQACHAHQPNHIMSEDIDLHFLDETAEHVPLARGRLFLPWTMIPTTGFLLHPTRHVLQQPLLPFLIPRAVARLTHTGR